MKVITQIIKEIRLRKVQNKNKTKVKKILRSRVLPFQFSCKIKLHKYVIK